jgi:hypothetical protein
LFPDEAPRGQIDALAISADGRFVLSGGKDGVLRLWDRRTGQLKLACRGHAGGITAVGFRPRAGQLASASPSDGFRLWDERTGKVVLQLTDDTDWMARTFVLSKDEATLTWGTEGGTVQTWDLASKKVLSSFRPDPGSVMGVFAVDDAHLVSYSLTGPTLRLWHLPTKRLVLEKGEKRIWDHITFSPDRKQLAVTSSKGVNIIDAHTFGVTRILDIPRVSLGPLQFSPSGSHLAVGLRRGSIQLLELNTGKCVASLEGHRGPVTSLCFTLDGKFLLSGSADTSIAIWDLARAGVKLSAQR